MNNLQLVLSGFNGATDISVLSGEDPDYLDIYLGLALLERVPNDPGQLLYQLMLARLVNSGVSLRLLAQTFKHAPATLKEWGAAVLSGDLDRILRAFSGRGPEPRMTPDIRSFTKGQYLALKQVYGDYRRRVKMAVSKKYGEEFSEGYLSRLFGEFDAESEVPAESEFSSSEDAPQPDKIKTNRSQDTTLSGSEKEEGVTYSCAPEEAEKEQESSRSPALISEGFRLPVSGVSLPDQPLLVHHAGQIIFSPWIDLASHGLTEEMQMQNQWLGQILQGAVNIEQSKGIAAVDISLFVGPVHPCHDRQRRELGDMANPEVFMDCMIRNSRLLGSTSPYCGRIFYYDPHGKEYTGAEHILKGWCGGRHGIGKMMYMDIVHTSDGAPCFIYHADNYYDMRERFFLMLNQFNTCFSPNQPRIWVFDRGIFGIRTFDAFLAGNDHFLTWEKGYTKQGWNDSLSFKSFRRCRERNRQGDIQVWHFDCQEHPWPKDPRIRRIIARATNPNGNTVEVAILCSDPDITAEEAVTLMFNRWIQENDYGYMDRHFGLNEITSYATQSYQEIEHTLHDRNVDCPEFRELKSDKHKAEAELKRELLKREKKQDLISKLEDEAKALRSRKNRLLNSAQQHLGEPDSQKSKTQRQLNKARMNTANVKELKRKLTLMEKRIARHKNTLAKLEKAIQTVKEALSELQQKIDTVLRDESRLKLLTLGGFKRLDMRKKAIMDCLKFISRNIFYSAAKLFRPIYNNYREDHAILRMISKAPGLITTNRRQNRVEISLWLEGTLQESKRHRIREFLRLITEGINQHFDGRASNVNIDLLEDAPFVTGAHVLGHTA